MDGAARAGVCRCTQAHLVDISDDSKDEGYGGRHNTCAAPHSMDGTKRREGNSDKTEACHKTPPCIHLSTAIATEMRDAIRHSHIQQKELFVREDPTPYNEPTTRSQMEHPLV